MITLDTPDDFAGTVRDFLTRDHARIEGLHDHLLDEVSTHGASAGAAWRRFEAAVLDHMEVEEQQLLRRYAVGHPREAAALRADHARLRLALDRLRSELRVGALQRFIRAFSVHARRENPLLYAWAERDVDRATQGAIARELTDRDRRAAFPPP